ncbi:MAG: heme lyase CcmF/NrfE family subunit [Gammaproteobacteria bacterium]|nr:heme lyase CcmF/NrfE family subunit [Gammaproteobacteria bacterium]
MIVELGHFALILALAVAITQGVVPLLGAWRGNREWMALAAPAARAQFLFVLIAYACLTYAFVARDFSVAYVAQNSNAQLPLFYRISAVWGAHEGSMLLWSLILAVWSVAVSFASGTLPQAFRARVLSVMGLTSIGFLLFMLMTSNPFERLLPAPADGRDLNPLLQDPGMVIHPPMLYMGYVGLAVPFAFAVAALLGGRLDPAWTRWTRPWTTIAWVFLTAGITLGSWWAYNELGWGGWWFWDPVENASFMPWLVATALIHSLAVSEQRGAFKAWTVLLAIFGFSLSLLGTFLVRSGVLVSVHAFATDPERGVFILAFLALVIGGALTLYAWRAHAISGGGSFRLLSRETLLLINNVLLTVACATVLLGTMYPLIVDALGLGKISVGPPYFDAVFVPLMLPLVFVLGFGPLTRWKGDSAARIARVTRAALIASVVVAAALVLATAGFSPLLLAALAMALWTLASAVQGLVARVRSKPDSARGVRALPRSFLGMTLAHAGVAVFIIGVAVTNTFSSERDVRLAPGASETLAGFQFRFDSVETTQGPNYRAQRAEVSVFEDDRLIATLHPEKRFYPIQAQPMTEAAVDVGFTRDLYVALGEGFDDGSWAVRLYYKPLVRWIWLGPLLMALGGLLAASDRRYRSRRRAERAAPRDAGGALGVGAAGR